MRIRLILLSLLIIALPLNAEAAVNSGSTCKKLGSTSISNGKKFTCVKVGKKLLWNKGVVLKTTPLPKPSPSPTPLATATPTPSPSSSPETQKLVFPTLPEIQKLDILVQNALQAATPVKAKIDIQVGPGEESAQIAAIAKESIDAALLIASILKIQMNTPLTVYVGKRDWLTPKMPAGTWCADPVIGVPGQAGGGFCGLSNGVLFLSVDGLTENEGMRITRNFSQTPDRFFVSFGFVHEIIHAMQAEASLQYAQSKGFYNPYWLNEGGANFGAMMSQAYIYKVPFSQIRVYIGTYSSCVTSTTLISIKDYIRNSGQSNVCGPYYHGYLWSEYFIASTGDFGSLIDLAKQNDKISKELTYDPNKAAEFDEKKLALSMKYGYSIDFDAFTLGAQNYAEKATLQLREWLSAKRSIYPQS